MNLPLPDDPHHGPTTPAGHPTRRPAAPRLHVVHDSRHTTQDAPTQQPPAARHIGTRAERLTDLAALVAVLAVLSGLCRTISWTYDTHGPHTLFWTLTITVTILGLTGPPLWAADGAPALNARRRRRCTTCCRP